MGSERLDPRFVDGRSFTSAIEGRRIGEKHVDQSPLGMGEILRKLQSNRKNHRIGGAAGQVLRDLALAADSVPELSVGDKRAFLITEFNARMPENTDRLLKLLGLREKPIDSFMEIVSAGEKNDLFQRARDLSYGVVDVQVRLDIKKS